MLLRFDRKEAAKRDWDAYSAEYSPEAVMKRFEKHFLPGCGSPGEA